jgi:cytochrome P450
MAIHSWDHFVQTWVVTRYADVVTVLRHRHLAFAWGPHFCFAAPVARLEVQIVLETMLRRMPNLSLQPDPVIWRENLAFRGLTRLLVTL